jgi:hypothetical protein
MFLNENKKIYIETKYQVLILFHTNIKYNYKTKLREIISKLYRIVILPKKLL